MDVPHHLYIYHPLNTSRNVRFDHLLLEWIRCGGRKKGRNLQVFFKIFSKININICNFFCLYTQGKISLLMALHSERLEFQYFDDVTALIRGFTV